MYIHEQCCILCRILWGLFSKKAVKKFLRQDSAPPASKVCMMRPFRSTKDQQEVHNMAFTIRPEDVFTALEPMLGTQFLSATPLCGNVADCLSLYAPSCMTLNDMFLKVRDVIFGNLYAALGQGMVLTLENGVRLRLRLKDIDTLADEALGLLLDVLPGDQLPLTFLRPFALETGLLCAMRVLLQRYGAVLPSMEREMLIRIVKENHPADRYSSWLD